MPGLKRCKSPTQKQRAEPIRSSDSYRPGNEDIGPRKISLCPQNMRFEFFSSLKEPLSSLSQDAAGMSPVEQASIQRFLQSVDPPCYSRRVDSHSRRSSRALFGARV